MNASQPKTANTVLLAPPKRLPLFRFGVPVAFVAPVAIGALALGLVLTLFGTTLIALGGVAVLALGILLLLRQDELLATLMVGAAILIDWYRLPGPNFQAPVVALSLGLIYAVYQFWTQSPETPWVPVKQIPAWLVLLVVAIPATLHSVYLIESVRYWLDVMLTGLVMYVVGTQVAANRARFTRLLQFLSGFGALLALQSLIYVFTGYFFLSTNRLSTYLSDKGDFHLGNGAAGVRAGSYLLNPDWNGAFLALMLFLPIGLAIASDRLWPRLLYSAEAAIIILALYYTFSLASIIAVLLGAIFLALLLLPQLFRRYAYALLGALGAGLVAYVAIHIRHIITAVTTDYKISIRIGAWTTGVKVILHYPLFGVGLGLKSYLAREEAFRLPLQPVPLAHPHNSYLELGAMGGVAVLAVFLTLLIGYFRIAIRHYRQADRAGRRLLLGPLLAMIVVAINSFGINELTLAPLLVPAWLIIGAVTSPYALRPKQVALSDAAQERTAPVALAQEGGV